MLQIEGPIQVARRSDVDMNGHINNVAYIAWTLETVPREVFYKYELQQVSHNAQEDMEGLCSWETFLLLTGSQAGQTRMHTCLHHGLLYCPLAQ